MAGLIPTPGDAPAATGGGAGLLGAVPVKKGSRKPRGGAGLLGSLQAGEGDPESLPVLEQTAAQVGAPDVQQDSPGLFRRALDLISRPNYAAAGAAEELFAPQGGGISAVPGRVVNELFSGLGGLQGQKEGFGQVLEQAGVGALGNFSDIPGVSGLFNDTGEGWRFQRGGWADPTGRGAVGLAGDIFLDPSTYLGFGVAGKTSKVGGKFLSETGQKLLSEEALKATGELGVRAAAVRAIKAGEAERIAARRLGPEITSQAANTIVGRGTEAGPALRDLAVAKAKERVQAAIDAGATDLLDKGGIKWAGVHIADNPLSAIVNSGVSKEIAARLAPTLPGRAVLASTAWTKKNLVDPLGSLFVKAYGIRGLEGARSIMDDAVNKDAWMKYLAQQDIAKSPLAPWLKKSEKEIEATFRPVIDAFQKGGIGAVPDEFKPAMSYYAKKVQEIYGNEVAAGLLQREQKLPNYFAQYYKNDPEELARVIYKQKGGLAGVQGEVNRLLRLGRNAEERVYDTLADAERISKELNAQNKTIPILEGIYNPIDSLTRRWEHSITKRVNREMTTALGDKFGPMATKDIYDLATPVQYGVNAARKKSVVDYLINAASKDSRLPSTVEQRVVMSPELRLANRNLKTVWDSVPIKYYEKQTLKNLDEASYFRRRGWDVIEEPADASRATAKYTAYKTNEVGTQEYASFSSKLRKAQADAAAATERATRDFEIPGEIVKGVNKVAAVAKLPDDAKRAFFLERFKQVGSREEAKNVVEKYDQFKEFWPKKLVQSDTDFAADGSRFIEFNPGQGSNYTVTLPESLANEVAGMSDHIVQSKAGRTLLQGFDTLNNFWKGSVTWLFPAFHVRNAYSNVAQSFVDIGMHAINPESYRETASILFGKGDGTFRTATGKYSYAEVRDILNRNGINTSARALAEFTGNESKILKPFKAAREAGTAIENESRAQLALNYMRRGMDPEEVGARVKNFQLDYANGLTNFERQWMKRIVPFYAFQRLNLGLQIENMLKRPGMLGAELKPFRGREDENAQMTSWDAGALKIRLNRDGKNVQMITGIDLPIRNLDLLFRGNVKDTFANAVGMLTPLLKVPIEVAANKSLFTGNDFNRANVPAAGRIVEQMPVSVQKWLGYDKTPDKAGRPQYTLDAQRYYLLGQSFVASRFLSTADRQWRQYIDKAQPDALSSLLDFTTGLRFQDMNMDEEMKKRAAERIRDLEQSLVRWGQRRQFERTYKPK